MGARGLIDERGSPELVVVAWVNDHALSAGALLALACDPIYMTPEAVIGAAMPVQGRRRAGRAVRAGRERARQADVARCAPSSARWRRSTGAAALAEAMVDREWSCAGQVDGVPQLMTQLEYDDARMRGDALELVRTIVPSGDLSLSLSGRRRSSWGWPTAWRGRWPRCWTGSARPARRVETRSSERCSRCSPALSGLARRRPARRLDRDQDARLRLRRHRRPDCSLCSCSAATSSAWPTCPHRRRLRRHRAGRRRDLRRARHAVVRAGGRRDVGRRAVPRAGRPELRLQQPARPRAGRRRGLPAVARMFVALVGAWGLSRVLPRAPIVRGLITAPSAAPDAVPVYDASPGARISIRYAKRR